MKNILSSILRQVSKQKYENNEALDVKEFIDNIRDVLQDKRYFIIIDDIWDESVWRLLQCVLIENYCGSKIITTTRNMGVARSCCSSDNVPAIIHELPPLSIDESRKLFYYKLFREDKCPPEFKDISENVLKRCDGLPLAILTTASLFASKKTKDQWYDVYNSIHTELENNQDVKDMWGILSLSYCDLPSQLKTCLLYLSLFPEDHNIERDDLIRRWAAEGFVHAKEDKNVYEVGENYFNKLINRNMIQPAYIDAHGRVQACRVHDIVLKFITSLSTEENFVTILNSQHPLYLSNKIRRLSLQGSKDEGTIPQATTNLFHVRSLVVFRHAIDFKLPLSSFQVLRVLDLEDCSSQNIKDIGNLVHLRYLRLSGTHCVELPKNIGNLQFLETLDIKQTRIKVLPSTVVQLRQLLRLYVDIRTKLPDGIGSMKSLGELSEIDISIYPNLMEMLGNLSKLRVLEISLVGSTWVKSYEEHFVKCLRNLKNLQTLNIIFAPPYVSLDFMLEVAWAPQHLQRFMACISRQTEHLFSLSPPSAWSGFSPFSTLPTWIDSSLSNLSELLIMVKKLRQEDLETLGGLPALSCLDLHVAESTKESRFEITANHAITFRCLATFRFASHAVRLVFRRGAMRSLQMLSLSFHLRQTKEIHGDCDMDMGLENLISLKAVEVGIDCYCAKLWEVQAAEAAVRNSTNLNPNHPTLDFSRHFERQMLWGGMEIPEPEATKELAGLAKIGPWGGNRGRHHDIRVAPHRLESIAICSGVVVDSLSFSYRDRDGQQHTAGPWGGYGGSEHMIQLRPSEFLTEISGTIGPFHRMHSIITSLTFVSNADSYGPFGGGGGTSFHIPVQCNGSIVGFFARAGWYIDAIGVYANPKLDEEEEAGLAKIGPWGGNGGMPCDTEVAPHCLQSVTIRSGGIVDSIAFSYSDRNGQQHAVGPWGGHGGSKYKFQLGPSEFLTGVSGTTGPFGALPNVITSLTFVTNARSYGPFGGGGGTPFHTPLRSNGSIVGFFGRASMYVDAIGVYANPELEIMKEDAGLSKIGPWGGHGGTTHDINVAPRRLESVTICSCSIVDSLAFSYSDNNGQQHSAGPWGGHGGSNYTIQLGPSEFLTKVSGTIGPFGALSSVITSLTIVTNAGAHGPFGQGGGIPFHAPMQSNDSIVGFFVRAGLYVDAIGFYARPL